MISACSKFSARFLRNWSRSCQCFGELQNCESRDQPKRHGLILEGLMAYSLVQVSHMDCKDSVDILGKLTMEEGRLQNLKVVLVVKEGGNCFVQLIPSLLL